MAKFKFDVFNAKDFQEELDRLNNYVATYKVKVEKAREAIAKRAMEIVKEEIHNLQFPYDIPSDMASDYKASLVAGLTCTIDGDRITISDDSDQAMFIEFGTGIMGKTSPHAPPVKGDTYEYDVNEHGYIGWDYIWGVTGKSLRNAPEENVFHTHGLPAGNFMFNTALRMQDEVQGIIAEVFKDD